MNLVPLPANIDCLIIASGALALLYGVITIFSILKSGTGDEKMKQIAERA